MHSEHSELENRRLLAEITVIALIAVAFHESVGTFSDSFKEAPERLELQIEVFVVFLLTAFRFFIGNHLHLQKADLLKRRSEWLTDFGVILLQCILLGVLGSLSPLKQEHAPDSFLWVLIVLYAVDILWIFGILRRRRETREAPRWVPPWRWAEFKGYAGELKWPWPWGAINLIMLAVAAGVMLSVDNVFDSAAFRILSIVNGLLAFVLDLVFAIPALLTIREPHERAYQPNDEILAAAIEEARRGLAEGGIPIGSVLVIDGEIVGRGHNRRVQDGSAIRHAEMDCLENAGRLSASQYQRATLYSTLSPCQMCSGAVLLYKIPTVIVGENRTFRGPEEYLRAHGVHVRVINNSGCIRMMEEFIREQPALWNEDIGEPE